VRTYLSFGRVVGVTLGVLGISFALHCGKTDDSQFAEGPCANELSGQCGAACTETASCGSGLYCGTHGGQKVCLADCSPTSPCASGAPCSATGQCVGGQFGETDGAILEGGGCAGTNVTLKGLDPTVLLLIDQSGSMKDNPFDNTSAATRWDVLKSALLDSTTGVIKKYEGQVSFGLALYSWDRKATCPQLTTVAAKFGNYEAINAVYGPADTIDNTPTAESLLGAAGVDNAGNAIAGGFAAMVTPGPKAVVLATDGDPDTCADPDSNGQPGPKAAVVAATQALFKLGIKTYVIAAAAEVNEQHQKNVANAGVGLDPAGGNAPYYRPSNQAELAAAFNTIVYGQRSCKFTLNGTVNSGGESGGDVRLNGDPLGLNDANGWRLSAPNEIEILGTSCQTLLNSPSAQLSATFTCGSFIPIN